MKERRERRKKRIREIGRIRRESKVWEVVRRERRGRSRINEGIGDDE